MKRNTIILGDCKPGMAALPAGCVDIIDTDPPYIASEWENAYTTLSRGAMHVLKPGGFCVTYTPQRHFDDIFDIMRRPGLRYYWIVPSMNEGSTTVLVHDRNAICLHKPMVIWQKPLETGLLEKAPLVFCDVVKGRKQKAFIAWQQCIHDVLGLLSRLAHPGDLVLDPFTGSATVLLGAKLLGMDWLGFEIDPVTYRIAKARMEQQPLTLGNFHQGEVKDAPRSRRLK